LILAAIPVSHIPRMPNAESQQKPTGHMNQPTYYPHKHFYM